MKKKESFTYAPSRGKGILFMLVSCSILIFLEIFLLQHFSAAEVGINFFLLLIALIILAVPLVFLLYRFYSLIFSYYRLERDGLHIQWGLRTEVIPLNAIEWIRTPAEMEEDVPWSVLPMPGAYLGTVSVGDHVTYEFLASDMGKMLFLGTSRSIYVISPEDPAGFVTGFERILQMGALTNIQWTTTRPANWLLEAWRNKAARICTIASIILQILLYIWVGTHFENVKTVPLRYSPTGDPLRTLPPVNILTIPLSATAIWLIGTALGLWIFQQKDDRQVAELLWGSVTAAVLQCLVAAVLVIR